MPITMDRKGASLTVAEPLGMLEAGWKKTRYFSYPQPVDLLLSDVVLPGERGPEIAADVVRARPDLRVMFMSGYADVDVFSDFGQRQPVRLLQKPFRRETLRTQVAEVLSGDVVDA